MASTSEIASLPEVYSSQKASRLGAPGNRQEAPMIAIAPSFIAQIPSVVAGNVHHSRRRTNITLSTSQRLAVILFKRVLSRIVLEFVDAISGISRVPSQAARSIG